MALSPPRSESDVISQLDATPVGNREIVILPVDLWVKDDSITVVVAIGALSEEVATMAAVEYAKHALSDPETLVLANGGHIGLVPMPPPGRDAPMIDFAPPAVRTVPGTKRGITWVIATPTVQSRKPLAAGKYRVTLSPRDIKLAVPSLDPWSIRFEPEQELEAHANPN